MEAFNSWYLLLAGLPKDMNFALENIHFMCTSSKVSSLDMAVPIANELQMLQEGIVMWDAKLGQNVLVIAPLFALLADNPRASELVNHLTGNPNLICRMCKVHGFFTGNIHVYMYICMCMYICPQLCYLHLHTTQRGK